ncbi:MAG TPA: glycosyltransferase [Rhizomicrobium sp.]|jgi:cellulose synthase/poly-beta-1,6-N-acetylglucosamine synthase-like glycosyltransferase/peptidoglycan/xylan/chitin deacetylase (PgdA/CDA1 family)|nr:glycosyltransferase [Rhizomicrobium sp.]
MANRPIFFDASGRRATGVTIAGWVAAAVSLILAAAFVVSLVNAAQLASVKLPGTLVAIHTPELEKKALAPGLLKLAENLASESRARRRELGREEQRLLRHSHGHAHALSPSVHPGRPLSIAFYPNWEPSAFDSLQSALPGLDWVIPTWLSLQGPDLTFKTSYDRHVYDLVRKKPSIAILPVVQNATLGKWDGPGLAKLLADPARRTTLIANLTGFVALHRLQGVTVDFEALPQTSYKDLGTFLKALTAKFSAHGWIVAMAAPFGDDHWPFAAFARAVDYTMLMAYDEHSLPNVPGSIAGQSWFETTLDKRMKVLNPSRTIIALGSYAYDWNDNAVDSLPFQDAVVAAHDSGADIDFDAATNNPHFSYMEDDDTRHDVWFLDAVTAFNQIHAADVFQPAGYALWRLGSEDPSIWTVMGKPYNSPAPLTLNRIPVVEDIDFEGEGELLHVDAEPTPGTRKFEADRQTGDIDDETYTKLPTGYVIHQFGAAKKEIALTFDDGPDAEWTPKILHILRQKHVHATFFIIGGNAEANPGLVQRLVADGNEVGNHTFTHPNMADTNSGTVMLELNATQRLFEALTGRSLRLFRPPYLGDAEPTDNDEIAPVVTAQNMGYIAVGEHIDPGDWQLPGAANIVKRSLAVLHNPYPHQPKNILLLHDAGGDRSQTVEALPVLIDKLRAEGYTFVTVSHLAGLTTDQVMPPLPPTVALLADRVVFMTLSALGHFLYICFLVAIWLASARLIFFIGLSLWNRRMESEQLAAPPADETTLVSVIVPAFNEEKVIARTIRGILASSYRNLEIIVVDDGSKDNTADVMEAEFGSESRVTLFRVPNGGKAHALNYGLAHATGAVFVALDADTQFQRDTIGRLVRWFGDPKIGAVAGNAKAGNRINMVTRWQALEYIVAQNMERRALAALGTLTVIPGAVGAWRRSAVEALGGFPADTVAEDQDLTIGLQRAGYRVLFDNSAIAWTEAPTTFGGLAKQRFRWAFGTLQCLWKYRRMTFNPRFGALGLVALPQVWLFQILLTALAPLADLLLLWQLVWQYLAYLEHGSEFSDRDLVTVGIYYGVFILVDLVTALFGFLMERREDWSLLLWLPLQRFGYRQLMYYVIVRSIWTAIRGPFVGWSKLERTGTVNVAHT